MQPLNAQRNSHGNDWTLNHKVNKALVFVRVNRFTDDEGLKLETSVFEYIMVADDAAHSFF